MQPLMRGTTVLSDRRSDEAGVGVNEFGKSGDRQGCTPTRWAPYDRYKWSYVITLINGLIKNG